MERYDIAIIGNGPAGLSATVTAKLRNKKIIVFGRDISSEKVNKAHEIRNYLGLGIVSGEQMQEAFNNHLKEMEIQVVNEKISAVYNMGSYFGIQGSPNIYEALTVILATGVSVQKSIVGEEVFLGKGVSYCATCDAMLYKNKTVAVLSYGKNEDKEAEFLAEIAKEVYYFQMYKEENEINENLVQNEKIRIIKETPKEITGDISVKKIITTENEYDVNGVFILRENIALSQLISGIELEDNHVVVSRKMQTNIKGCFACGDITGTPYQYIKAAGEGNVAALSAVSYIAQKGDLSR